VTSATSRALETPEEWLVFVIPVTSGTLLIFSMFAAFRILKALPVLATQTISVIPVTSATSRVLQTPEAQPA